jgi:hypothetical protein
VKDMTPNQMRDVEQKLAAILSSVDLGWEKAGPHPVPAPEMQMPAQPRRQTPPPVVSPKS